MHLLIFQERHLGNVELGMSYNRIVITVSTHSFSLSFWDVSQVMYCSLTCLIARWLIYPAFLDWTVVDFYTLSEENLMSEDIFSIINLEVAIRKFDWFTITVRKHVPSMWLINQNVIWKALRGDFVPHCAFNWKHFVITLSFSAKILPFCCLHKTLASKRFLVILYNKHTGIIL